MFGYARVFFNEIMCRVENCDGKVINKIRSTRIMMVREQGGFEYGGKL